MITVRRWNGSSCKETGPEGLPESAAGIAADEFVWVDLSDPTPEEEAAVFQKFLPVHPLSLEDVTRIRREPDRGAHFPKVEEFPDYLFVIVNPLPPGLVAMAAGAGRPPGAERLPSASRLLHRHRPQLSAVLSHSVLITHSLERLACIETAHRYLSRHGDSARRGPDYVFHIVLDAMVDEYAPVVEWVATKLDHLEARIFTNPSPKLIHRILRLKRVVTGMRKTLIIEREVLARLIRGEFELVEAREIVYYRNVYDHLVRYTELIEAAREMVSDMGETHLAAVSNRLNEVMKVLAMISTTILPLTLISSVYGMNFKHMPELEWEYGYPVALAAMLATGLASVVFFRWKRWI
ncbi:Magnesium transport protein CorA [Gemmata obscuriglobus]|uniref:Magnesium transport protein CorA n=1 Tax=Gemmata obscuriglobus TaxID=114 RepID=A0A2Z3GUU8_9BACT|nr:magnesium/cobalt transporter CorA [Gemmata obscuriglobus]AWM38199.1 magnesium and cobalt transport protein CorA [Gemmata obscuriglobus]QEG28899.1 Magnesium transport protein CorA [Gemmata obscuriglobus]VTS07369.1 magnesium and cobalt transport protein : Magnesium and cobalt transport protein CorA OS=Herpetosiphon aurantiacus (strain ATCC 23779 / DSM 785) GN=Haur_4037 PE=4 SV=1: CorA [Gemmata obscuriglobus UQM 2246]